jgi:hypothetical protein
MAADDTVTWGEVCKSVSYRDGLYRVCKDKVSDFNGFPFAPNTPGLSSEGAEPDFASQLARSAKPIPPPPAAEWEPEDEPSFARQMLDALSVERLAVYGILGAVVWYFFLRKEGSAAPQAQQNATPVTSSKAA